MILGELPGIKKLLVPSEVNRPRKLIGKQISLDRLEVVQVFHVTPIKNRESILEYGLLPKSKLEGIITYPPAIFVATTYREAAFDYVNHTEVDVWTFYLPKHLLCPDEFTDFTNHYYVKQPVPYYKLTLLETIL